jgi:hypothetical protein
MNRRDHWSRACREKGAERVSWYQKEPYVSLGLISHAGISKDAGVIDVGGGASVLVDRLLDQRHAPMTVVDVSDVAL